MTKIQIISDLHIEYKNNQIHNPLKFIKPEADILILAGDIGSLYKYHQLKTFISDLSKYFKLILYVPGNHEYYKQPGYKHEKMSQLNKKLFNLQKYIKNLYILKRSFIQFQNICIIGCTLWTDSLVKVPPFIVRIHEMNTKIYKKEFNKDLNFIKKMIDYTQQNNLKLITVTHHCPTYSVIKNKNKDKFISLYASHLDHLLYKHKIDTWICGHLHTNFDIITPGGTHLIGNQKGKPKDKITDFKKNLVLII